jgi:phage terminase small subunit
MSKPLTNDAHERFCQEYLVDLNATAAYQRAYPSVSDNAARANASRLLTRANVQARVADLQAERAARTQVTADRVIRELARIGFADMRDYAEWGPRGVRLKDAATLTEDQARAIAEVSESIGDKSRSQRFKLHDKITALTKLGQHLGLFTEKVEHSGPGGGPILGPTLTAEERVTRVQQLLQRAAERARAHREALDLGDRPTPPPHPRNGESPP